MSDIPQPDFSKDPSGLVPAIAQDFETGECLMLAYINEEAWQHTLKTGKATYWSRSRSELWCKGDTSGNVQNIKDILIDCDRDTVIYKVENCTDTIPMALSASQLANHKPRRPAGL